MYNKDKIYIEIDNMEKYEVIYGKISKHCELWIGGSKDFSIPGDGGDNRRCETGVYKFLENHTLKDLIKELGELCCHVTFKDYETKEVIRCVGKVTISFDKVDFVKIGTFEKLDKIKQLKQSLATVKVMMLLLEV